MTNEHATSGRPLPGRWEDNPFQAPEAPVDDLRSGDEALLANEPNRVAAGRGAGWWSSGWEMFREAPGLWIGICLAYFVFTIVIGMIPIIGIVSSILYPVIFGGLMLGCRSLARGEGLRFGHLFAGFEKSFGALALAGLLYVVGIVVVMVGIFVVVGGLVFAATTNGGGEPNIGMATTTIVLAVLVGMALSIPLMMAIWFAPPLIALNDLGAIAAMKLSFRGCLRNFVPFLVYGLVGFVLAILATIPLGLGWLVLVPTMICSMYASYREIFTTVDQ